MANELTVFRHEDRSLELVDFLSRMDKGCLATTDGTDVYIAVIFIVYDNGRLFFKSRTASNHSTHVRSRPVASMGVYLESSTYDAKYGAQLIGSVTRILDASTMQRCVELYGAKFAGSAAKLPSIEELCSPEIASTFYQFAVERFKIVDEDKSRNRTMLQYEDFHEPHAD